MTAAMGSLACSGIDALACMASCDTRTDLLDNTRKLGAGRRWKRRHMPVSAGTDQYIGHAHPDRMRPDQDFARLQIGDRHVEVLQHSGGTRLVEPNELHG